MVIGLLGDGVNATTREFRTTRHTPPELARRRSFEASVTEVQEALREPCLPFFIGGNGAARRATPAG
jgi:hypothetical protein